MIIGVTGSLATGTSTAARYISSYLKADLIDADKITHTLLRKKSSVGKRIVSAFGKTVLTGNGTIDRAKLAKVAFSKKLNLKRLCDILHPVVIKNIDMIFNKYFIVNSIN